MSHNICTAPLGTCTPSSLTSKAIGNNIDCSAYKGQPKSGCPHERGSLLDAFFGVQHALAWGPVVYGSSAACHTILSSWSSPRHLSPHFSPPACVLSGCFGSHVYVLHMWEVFVTKTKTLPCSLAKWLAEEGWLQRQRKAFRGQQNKTKPPQTALAAL